MKFGKTLYKELVPEWEEKYLDYQALKTRLKDMGTPETARVSDKSSLKDLTDDEISFIKAVDQELEKVVDFYSENEKKLVDKYMMILEEIQIFLIHDEQQQILLPTCIPESSAFTPMELERFKGQVLRITNSNLQSQREKEEKYFEQHGGYQRSNGGGSNEEKKRVKNSIKKALLEYYRHLQLLKEYKSLNLNGFVKILKKFDKYRYLQISSTFSAKVQQQNICTSTVIETLMKNVEQLTKVALCEGDRHSTMEMLRLKNTHLQPEYSNCSMASFLGGISMLLTLYSLFSLAEQEERAFKSIVAILSIFMLLWSCGFNAIIWSKYNVNYKFIFGFDLRNCLTPYKFLLIVSCMSFVFSLALLAASRYLFLLRYVGVGFLAFFAITLAFMRLFGGKPKSWMPITLARVFFPALKVRYGDFFVADQLTSILITFEMLPTIVLLPFDKNTAKIEGQIGSLLMCVPYFIRLAQCVRRFYDGRVWYPHLVSFCKYLLSIVLYVVIGYCKAAGSSNASHFPYNAPIVIPMIITCTLFNAFWDSFYDFGLFHRASVKYSPKRMVVFREKYIYPTKVMHFLIFAANIIFRFAWILKLKHSAQRFATNGQLLFLVALECFRRFLWNLIRIENEQISNCGLFRAVLEIPLPFESSFQQQQQQQQQPTDPAHDQEIKEKEDLADDNYSINFAAIGAMSKSFAAPISPSSQSMQV